MLHGVFLLDFYHHCFCYVFCATADQCTSTNFVTKELNVYVSRGCLQQKTGFTSEQSLYL